MSVKFKNIHKTRLRNDPYMQFMTELKGTVYTRLACLPAPVRTFFNTVFLVALAAIDEGLKKIRKSALTKQIQAADRERDDAFLGMADLVRSTLRHFDPLKRAAALRLQIVFDTHGNVAVKALNAETAAITNLLQDLRSPAYADDTETVGLTEWAAVLENRNFAVNNLIRQRGDEEVEKTDVVLRHARADMDAAYDQLTTMIEAFVLLGVGEPENLETASGLIVRFNQTIDMFNRLIKKPRPGGGAADDDEDETPDGQEGGEQGE